MSKETSRYLKPGAGRLALASERFLEFGDRSVGYGVPMMSILVGVLIILPLSLEFSVWFCLALTPAILVFLGWMIFLPRSVPLANGANYYYEARYIWMPRIKKAGREGYGTPLMKEILEHTKERHVSKDNCSSCQERLDTMTRLAPAGYESRESIELANEFVKQLNELKGITA